MQKIKKDFIIGLFFLVLGLLYFFSAFSIGTYKGYASQNISSAFIPKVLGIFLVLLSASLLLQTYMVWCRLKAARKAGRETADPNPGFLFFKPEEIRSFLAVFGVLIVYITLLEPVGFLLTSVFFLFAAIKIMAPEGKFNWQVTAIISLVVPVCVYGLFVYGLDMVLPSGILG